LIRVFIDSDRAVVRAGLAALLESDAGIEVADSPVDADVVLRDEASSADPAALPVVLLTDAPPSVAHLRSGARAVLPRDVQPEQITAAVRAVVAGLVAVPVEAGAVVVSAPATDATEALTPRELETLEMMAEGLSNKQIAYRLGISDHTAKFHVNSIFAKLGAGTRTEAVMRGIRMGLVKV
jgi:DNA-binding NarL/FixJ family response regulator